MENSIVCDYIVPECLNVLVKFRKWSSLQKEITKEMTRQSLL